MNAHLATVREWDYRCSAQQNIPVTSGSAIATIPMAGAKYENSSAQWFWYSANDGHNRSRAIRGWILLLGENAAR